MSSSVTFQVERVVEALGAEDAQVALDAAVTLEVTIEQTLQRERLLADGAHELVLVDLLSCKQT